MDFINIGIIKPDYKIRGGFEIVVDKLKEGLEKEGHKVTIVYIDATDNEFSDIPQEIPKEYLSKNGGFYQYINNCWKFMKLDVSHFDWVISTQPPSYMVNHPRHIAFFYHHMKNYYDMSELIQEIGLVEPYHKKASSIIREIDTQFLKNINHILAGSKTIENRLARYNGITENVDIVYAGLPSEFYDFQHEITYELPIIVGRHEFPKRPELFVAAMKKISEFNGKIIGSGGRTEDLKRIDGILTYTAANGIKISDEFIWKYMSVGQISDQLQYYFNESKAKKYKSNVIFTGRVSHEQLLMEYASASCVVCPAFEEDYGLTAIEAMACKKAIIACKDGGGYTEIIQDGINGFLVEPTSEAIAEAIKKLTLDKQLAKKMGQAAFETSRSYTWENTIQKFITCMNS